MTVETEGYIMQLQNFSVNDGDGVRTTIFLAGCPLDCIWCCNPENKVCFDDAHKTTLAQVEAQIARQALFFRRCRGGITFSGGEATVQQGFLRAMTDRFYDKGYSLTLETCGFFVFDEVKDILEKMDLIFIDVKQMDDALHKIFTGVTNGRILENLARMQNELTVPLVVRIPLIVGVNADAGHIEALCRFLRQNVPRAALEFLPYHRFGEDKYRELGMESPDERFRVAVETIRRCGLCTSARGQGGVGEKDVPGGGQNDVGEEDVSGGGQSAVGEEDSGTERMEIPDGAVLENCRRIAGNYGILVVSYR